MISSLKTDVMIMPESKSKAMKMLIVAAIFFTHRFISSVHNSFFQQVAYKYYTTDFTLALLPGKKVFLLSDFNLYRTVITVNDIL